MNYPIILALNLTKNPLGRDSFIMNMDDYSIVCFHDIIIYYMFPANNFGDSLAGNLRFAIFAINFFEHFK